MNTTRSVTLKDRAGQPHEYRIELHPHAEGFALATRLVKILGPSAAKMLFEAFQAHAAELKALDPEDPKSQAAQERVLADVLSALNIDAVLEAALGRLVADGGLQALVPSLLAYTFRDGVMMSGPLAMACYQGNYGESIQAVREVIDHNGFLEVLSSLVG